MSTDDLRTAIESELDRTIRELGDDAGEALPVTDSRDRLIGYRDGLDFALDLLASAAVPEAAGEPVGTHAPTDVQPPEPELVDQLTRIRNTET